MKQTEECERCGFSRTREVEKGQVLYLGFSKTFESFFSGEDKCTKFCTRCSSRRSHYVFDRSLLKTGSLLVATGKFKAPLEMNGLKLRAGIIGTSAMVCKKEDWYLFKEGSPVLLEDQPESLEVEVAFYEH